MMLWILVLAILLIVILLVWGMLVAHSRIDEILQEMGQFVYYPVEYPKGGCADVVGDPMWKEMEWRGIPTDYEMNGDDLG